MPGLEGPVYEFVCVASVAIVWFASAFGAAAIARRKGEKTTFAFMIGLLLGPLALIAAALAPRAKKCPACAESVKRDAKICRYCGHEFS